MEIRVKHEYDEKYNNYLYGIYLDGVLLRKVLRHDDMISNVMSLKRSYGIETFICDYITVIK